MTATRVVRGLVLALAAIAVAAYVGVALARIGHPFELEWMEGGVVDHVRRVQHGRSLYTAPSLTFTPYLYTPLYYWVAAAFTAVLGVGLFPLRLVSVLASIGLGVAVWSLVRAEGRSRWGAAVGVGLVAACYRVGGAWFDLAREDTLCLALLFGGLAVARRADRTRHAVVAGLLGAAAVLTKQVAILPAIAVVPYLVRRDRRLGVAYAGAVAIGAGVPAAVLEATTHGWFGYYVVDVPRHHGWVASIATTFWTHDVLATLPLALALAVVGLLCRGRDATTTRWFHAPVLAAAAAVSYVARLHSGGYDNVLLPVYIELCVLAGVAVDRLTADVPSDGASGRRARARAYTVALVAGAAVVVQFALLAYDPTKLVPSSRATTAGRALLRELRDVRDRSGPIYLPSHGWMLARVGQPTTAHAAAMADVMRAHVAPWDRRLAHQLWDSVAAREYAVIVVDGLANLSYLPDDLCMYYRPDRRLPGTSARLPVTGTATAPATLWVRRDDVGAPCGAVGRWTVGRDGRVP